MKKVLAIILAYSLIACLPEEDKDSVNTEDETAHLAQFQTSAQKQQLAQANRKSCLEQGYSSELCNAINTGNPAKVSEQELLQFAEDNVDRLIKEQADLIEFLYDGHQDYSFANTNNNVFISSPAMNSRIVLYANKDGRTSAIKDTYKIIGALEKTDHRVGLFSLNLLSLNEELAIQTFHENLIKWFTQKKSGKMNIVFSHFFESRYETNKAFITKYFPEASFSNYGECDFGELSKCIDKYKPDLIIYSSKRNTNQFVEDVEPGIKKAISRKIPFLAIVEGKLMSEDSEIMMQPIYRWLGHPNAEQGYGNARPHAQNASVDELKKLPSLAEIKQMIQRMRDGDFTLSAIESCSTNSTIISCASEEYLEQFGNAATYIRNLLQNKEAKKVDVFKSDEPDNFLKSILLLADKYRSQVDYPIHKSETHDFMKALFADLFTTQEVTTKLNRI